LWAGPLATHLLSLAGARVIKGESTRRPDGARRGPRAFYDLLNAGKESVALDFTANDARRTLAAILERADIVVEASRPRALAQLGIDAVSLVRSRPGMVWVGITGYGRREPECNRVAFGDDAGAAAGLAMAMCRDGRGDARLKDGPVFCGDAIADPLTGMHAALAALCAWQQGGGLLLDVNLHDVTAHVLGAGRVYCEGRGFSPLTRSYVAAEDDGRWEVVSATGTQPVLAPRAREVSQRAEELGAHTRLVLEELGTPC
jgi:crotonobetainyl-CoA:carnitine CoA-transferase CaiB-like acyl-CoA transferase